MEERKIINMNNEKQVLINKYEEEFKLDEVSNEDFISRIEFINRTGIFVTPNYFDMIYDDFKASGVSANEFVNNYEEKYSNCIQELPLTGTFKYEVCDDDINCMGIYDDTYEPNIWEIMNSLAMAHDHQWRSKDKITREMLDLLKETTETNKKLIKLVKGEDYNS